MGWTLADIRAKIRSVAGAPSADQVSDTVLNAYINNYYVYTMPFELKVQIENDFLDFKTVPGQDVYSFPGGYFTDSPGAYADGFPMIFYQDLDIFYQDWPQQYSVDNVNTGNGVSNVFSGTLQNPPLIMGSLFITDGTQVAQDNGLGQFTGDVVGSPSGSIDYTTGAYTVNFALPPSAQATIYAKYLGYQGNRPQGILFFDNQFTLRPVPDAVYQIRLQGYIKPNSLVDSSSIPLQEEWGPVIAYGVCLEIFSDRGDLENYNKYYPVFKRWENVALGRTVQQFSPMQSVPRF